MGRPATPSPDALRPSNRTVASSRLFCPESLLPLPFPSLLVSESQLGNRYWLGGFLFVLFAERLDLHVHSSRKVKLHQRIHRLRRRIENIQQALVRADLELLARFLVHVRRTQHGVLVLHRGQRNRTRDLSAGALGRGHDLGCRLIEHAIVVCLQPDANFLVSNHFCFPDPFRHLRKERACGEVQAAFSYCTISEIVPAPTVCPPSRMAKRKPFSIATGVISSITSCTLSPGITISVPPGNSATPVTSVVRK